MGVVGVPRMLINGVCGVGVCVCGDVGMDVGIGGGGGGVVDDCHDVVCCVVCVWR